MAGFSKIYIMSGIKSGIPIFIGYFPSAAAFGILAKGCGISFVECMMFSVVVFAGASQFIALNMVAAGAGPVGIILTTLLVNFRHFLMSTYLSTRTKVFSRKWMYLIAFGVTDEVFSVLSFHKGKLTASQVILLEGSAYSGWVIGTAAGFILGGFLPEVLTQSMGVALYSLLLAILIPAMQQSFQVLMLTVASGLLNTLLVRMDFLPDGWSIIVCILVISSAGAVLFQARNKDEKHG